MNTLSSTDICLLSSPSEDFGSSAISSDNFDFLFSSVRLFVLCEVEARFLLHLILSLSLVKSIEEVKGGGGLRGFITFKVFFLRAVGLGRSGENNPFSRSDTALEILLDVFTTVSADSEQISGSESDDRRPIEFLGFKSLFSE